MPINRDEMHLWAGAIGAACMGLLGASVVPHPYDKVVMGLAGIATALAAYFMTPTSKP